MRGGLVPTVRATNVAGVLHTLKSGALLSRVRRGEARVVNSPGPATGLVFRGPGGGWRSLDGYGRRRGIFPTRWQAAFSLVHPMLAVPDARHRHSRVEGTSRCACGTAVASGYDAWQAQIAGAPARSPVGGGGYEAGSG